MGKVARRSLRKAKPEPYHPYQRDWTLWGYNYLGAGNPAENGPPTDEDDAIARIHDNAYQGYMDQGLDPYWNHNEADTVAEQQFGHGYGGYLGKAFFAMKRKAADAGLIGRIPPLKKLTFNSAMSKRRNDDDVDMNPAPLARSAGTGTSSASGARSNNGETPVDPVRYKTLRPFPDTMNVVMPWTTENMQFDIGLLGGNKPAYAYCFRLNSIYDVSAAVRTYNESYTPVADGLDAGPAATQPAMYQFWKGIYKYWTVVKMDYKIEIWGKTNNNVEYSVWVYEHGAQMPPTADGTAVCPDFYRRMHPGAREYKYRGRNQDAHECHQLNPSNILTIHGSYNDSTDLNDVAEDNFSQTWTKFDFPPPLHEKVTVIVQPSDKNSATIGNLQEAYCKVTCVYHVQMKDLYGRFIYPMASTDFSAVTDFAKQGGPVN